MAATTTSETVVEPHVKEQLPISTMFTPLKIGNLEIKNRTMRSATWEGIADESGAATETLIKEMVKLADGDVGLVMLSHGFVEERGKAGAGQICLAKDEIVRTYQPLVDRLKAHDPRTLLGVQLAHAGRLARSGDAIGPSANKVVKKLDGEEITLCKEMTVEDINQVVQSFADAAFRCKILLGADVFQIHAAHGYLLSQFLNPLFNKRTDEYGGSIENRARLLLRVVAAVRERIGPNAVIAVKLNTEDFVQGGLTVEESTQVVMMLAKAGVTLVEASGGSVIAEKSPIRKGQFHVSDEGYHREGSRAWKRALVEGGHTSCAVAMVGGNRTGTQGDKLIREGVCDIISMSRALIREPDLVYKWETLGLEHTGTCVSCSLCHADIRAGKGYHCVVDYMQKMKRVSSFA